MSEWYVIHVAAGSENKVASEVKAQFQKNGIMEMCENIIVPKRCSEALRRGKKIAQEERIFPGYVFIKMACSSEALHIIRRTPRVMGMLGEDIHGVPKPLSEEEIRHLIAKTEEINDNVREKVTFEIGEIVRVSGGAFASMDGTVEEIDKERSRLKISISFFGRSTPLELEFTQVEKLS